MSSLERRARKRFILDLPLRFEISKGRREVIRGSGTVTNISSKGLAFRTDVDIPTGLEIHATVNWPVALNENCGLKIAFGGRILRSDQGEVVMSVGTYEFRTNRASAQPSAGGM